MNWCYRNVQIRLQNKIYEFFRDGYLDFISSARPGMEMVFCELVIGTKQWKPFKNARLHIVQRSTPGQAMEAACWGEREVSRYNHILNCAEVSITDGSAWMRVVECSHHLLTDSCLLY